MPVSTQTTKNSYVGDDATTEFPFTFAIKTDSELLVNILRASNEIDTLILDTDYYVQSTAGNYDDGGTCVLTSPLETGDTLYLSRQMTITQPVDLYEGGNLPAQTVEDMVDRLTIMVQEIYEKVNRSFKGPITDGLDLSSELPVASLRANKYLKFNADGEPSAVESIEPGSATISAFAETILDDTSANAARVTLGDYDLVIGSAGDFALLENGAGGTYARVLVKAGTYTTSVNLDLNDHNVQVFEGETLATQITFSSASGNKITMEPTSVIRRMKLISSGANSGTDYIINGANGARTYVEEVHLESSNVTPVGGMTGVLGGAKYCLAKELDRGFSQCYNLSHCEAQNCVTYGFYLCYELAVCDSTTSDTVTTLQHFSSCYRMSACRAYRASRTGTDVGFMSCENLVACYASLTGSKGFSNSYDLAGCSASACGTDGFYSCSELSACRSTGHLGDGFESCSRLTSCFAQSNTGSGFKSCTNMAACDSNTNVAADTANSEPIIRKIVGFTAWNMDTTATLAIAHGCTLADIRAVKVVLFNNGGTAVYDCPTPSSDDLALDLSMTSIDATNINLRRRATPGIFDAAGFNAAYGYVVIDYIAAGI